MDAITLLKQDHQAVEALFKRFEKAGDGAIVEKRAVVDKISEQLSIHAAVEEQLFYPVTRAAVPATEDIALESLEEHHIVKWVLSELESMSPEDERFDAKVTVLIENVRHHIKEEEEEYFPMVRAELGRHALTDLGDAMVEAKKVAPTHPHPDSPDTPPGNLAGGVATGVVDRVGDTVNGMAQGGVAALGDLIATVLRREKPSLSPRGSSTARSTASRVRDNAAKATEAVVDVASQAQETVAAVATVTAAASDMPLGKPSRSAQRTPPTTARGVTNGTNSTQPTTATKSTKPAKSTKATKSSKPGAGARKGKKRTTTSAKRTATSAKRTAKTRTTAPSTRKVTKRAKATPKRATRPVARSAR